MKKILLATTAFAAVTASASAVDVEMYGQVNKGIFAMDDGNSTEVAIMDNDISSTRFGMKGAQALDNGLTASVLLEGEIQNNDSSSQVQNTTANQSNTPTSNGGSFAARQARVGIGGDWGAVFLGTQSVATDSVAEQDLVGAADVMGSSISDIGGGLAFNVKSHNVTTPTISTGVNTNYTVGGLYSNFDGDEGENSVRYDSPIVNGFQGRISTSQGGDVDTAVYYAGEVEGLMVKGAVGYSLNNDDATATNSVDDMWTGSLSAKHESGLAATFAYGQGDAETGTDPEYMYVKAGYAWDNKEVAVDYADSENATGELTSYGVAGQINLGGGVSAAALYRELDADVTDLSIEKIKLYGVNMRVKF